LIQYNCCGYNLIVFVFQYPAGVVGLLLNVIVCRLLLQATMNVAAEVVPSTEYVVPRRTLATDPASVSPSSSSSDVTSSDVTSSSVTSPSSSQHVDFQVGRCETFLILFLFLTGLFSTTISLTDSGMFHGALIITFNAVEFIFSKCLIVSKRPFKISINIMSDVC